MLFTIIKKTIKALLPKAHKTELNLLRRISVDYGHYNSVKQQSSVDRDGNCLPWYTYPAIDYLIQFDYKNKDIFEWGAGNSSIFWAERAKYVVSVEDDPKWFELVTTKKRENNTLLLLKAKEDYVNSIKKQKKKFDVIVIDAKYRPECASLAPSRLKKGGMIIFDNADRFPNLCEQVRKNAKLIEIDFTGFAPINDHAHTTSIFLDRNFAFRPLERQPLHSPGSLHELCE